VGVMVDDRSDIIWSFPLDTFFCLGLVLLGMEISPGCIGIRDIWGSYWSTLLLFFSLKSWGSP